MGCLNELSLENTNLPVEEVYLRGSKQLSKQSNLCKNLYLGYCPVVVIMAGGYNSKQGLSS